MSARQPADARITPREPAARAVLSAAAGFLVLAALLFLSPSLGATIFGLGSAGLEGRFYLCVIAIRDAALAVYMIGLVLAGSRRALTVLLACTVMIPVGDIVMVALRSPYPTPLQFLLHGGSALLFTGLTIVVQRTWGH